MQQHSVLPNKKRKREGIDRALSSCMMMSSSTAPRPPDDSKSKPQQEEDQQPHRSSFAIVGVAPPHHDDEAPLNKQDGDRRQITLIVAADSTAPRDAGCCKMPLLTLSMRLRRL